jgi:ribosomal protein L37AE/L43A
MAFGAAKCPKCGSADVEPANEKLWHCRSCGNDFQEASVEILPDEPKKKGAK